MKKILFSLFCYALLALPVGLSVPLPLEGVAHAAKPESDATAAASHQAALRYGTILVAFGTTVPESRVALNAIGQAFEKHNAGQPLIWAYTSDIIRRKLDKRGEKVLSVNEAMNKAAQMGINRLTIQSLHVGAAEEFHQLERMIVKNLMRHPGRFMQVMLGHPLLESEKDMDEVVASVLAEFPAERKKDEAIVLMGHGNARGPGDLMLYAVGKAFTMTDPLVFVAAVEGSSTFDKVLATLKEKKVKKVWLQPLMIVAGDHARNDMAGPEEDSWASQLKKEGIEAVPHFKGLGELKGVHKVFLRHATDTRDDIANSKKSD